MGCLYALIYIGFSCFSGSNPKIDSFGGEEFGVQLIEADVAWESQFGRWISGPDL